ncbi:sigma-70 family RNA polymerase sigma factor [Pelagibius sp. CAU 1746]|uniref:RNA polymerase sigma factor n=1 Tax=Pelagibius sp. CAU 1746 TaxID=3140370 RepID=UPI00325B0AE7
MSFAVAVEGETVSGGDADLAALLDGNKAAWDRFVARHAAVIFAAVRRRLVPAGRTSDAEDVVQDVFVKLCQHDFRLLRGYDESRAKITTWLTVVANSAAIDHLRRLRRRTEDIEAQPEAVLAVDPVIPEKVKIPDGLLSPRQALVLELLYRRDMTPGEAAEVIGIDPQTVRSMHHKALVKLRGHFQAEMGEDR